jgi:transcriptional regulator with XRE-family HTH domain
MISRYINGKSEPTVERIIAMADFFSKKLGEYISLDEMVGRVKPESFELKEPKIDPEVVKKFKEILPYLEDLKKVIVTRGEDE